MRMEWFGIYEKPLQTPDNKQTTEVLLVDTRGKALLQREPRTLGFNPKRLEKAK